MTSMKQYAKYICSSLIVPMTMITLTLTGIVWLTQSSRYVDMIVNHGVSLGTFVYMTGLLLPSLLMVILPVALFCSVTFVFYKLIVDSELVVMQSAGLSTAALLRPVLLIGVIVTLIGYAFSLYLLPVSYREFKDLQYFLKDNYASVLLEEGVFNTPINGLTVYIDERNNDKLKGILVHDNRIPGKPVTMMAKEGMLYQTAQGPHFELIHGNRQDINMEKGRLSVLYFDHYAVNLRVYMEKHDNTRGRRSKERFINELFMPKDVDPKYRPNFYAEGHQRLTWPLYSIILPLVGFYFLTRGEFNRRGNWKRSVEASVCMVVIVATGMGLINLCGHFVWMAAPTYLYFFGLIALLLWLILKERTTYFKSSDKLSILSDIKEVSL